MNIAPVDYMPVKHTPPANTKKDQTGSLYLDGEKLKRVKKESGCIEYFSMTAFRLSGISPTHKFISPNPVSYIKAYVTDSYDGHIVDRGFKTFVGRIVDAVA
jgi:hypothetical protein